MSLEYNPLNKGGVYQPAGVEIRAPNFGVPTGSIDYLDPGVSYWTSLGDYFATMRDKFVGTYGYKEGVDLFAAPYDWRLAPNLRFWVRGFSLNKMTIKNDFYFKQSKNNNKILVFGPVFVCKKKCYL